MTTDRTSLDDVVEEFAREFRTGRRPAIETYLQKYPELAEDLPDMLSAVVMMEQAKPRRESGGKAPEKHFFQLERLGEYRIVRELGRGGMGIVYEAEQETLGRRVAIKILSPHLASRKKLQVRFQREAQSAAKLHHTNIVPVYGVGECEGRCFYVMQLIEGTGLDHILRKFHAQSRQVTSQTNFQKQDQISLTAPLEGHSLSSTDFELPATQAGSASTAVNQTTELVPNLPQIPQVNTPQYFRFVAELGKQVASALAYAHSKGILHRDIKPSNLMLDPQLNVWITDFGLARAISDSNLTETGDIIGTLKYMPPERFQGSSTPQGDVYSLGITLYELATQQMAFPDTNPQQMLKLITQKQPDRPRKRNSLIPKDLETIILKAIALDPKERYADSASLEEDLDRFLDDRTILARRTTSWEQARRWCKRNPVMFGLIATALLLMATTTIVSFGAYRRTANAKEEVASALALREKSNQQLQRTLQETRELRDQAEASSRDAFEVLNRIYERLAPNRVYNSTELLLDDSDEDTITLPTQPFLSKELVPFMEEILVFYEGSAQRGAKYPQLRLQSAEASQRIGDIRQRMGEEAVAVPAYVRALEIYEEEFIKNPHQVDLGLKMARTWNELGVTYRILAEIESMLKAHSEAEKLLVSLADDAHQRPEYLFELARTYFFLAQRGIPGRTSSSVSERFLGFGPPHGGPMGSPRGPGPGGPGGPGRKPPFGGGFGKDRGPGGKPSEPPPQPLDDNYLKKAITLLEDLREKYPTVPDYQHLLACCYREQPPSFRSRTNDNQRKAVELLQVLAKNHPDVSDYQFDLSETLARVDSAQILFEGFRGDNRKRDQLTEALNISTKLYQNYPGVPKYAALHAQNLNKVGMLRLGTDKSTTAAEKMIHDALTIQTKLTEQNPTIAANQFWLQMIENSYVMVLSKQKKWPEAKAILENGIAKAEKESESAQEANRWLLSRQYFTLGTVMIASGDKEGAATAFRKATELSPFGKRPDDRRPTEKKNPPPKK
ncbi:MAG: serine/threonine-protein kinase [Zavarzinella sp.]